MGDKSNVIVCCAIILVAMLIWYVWFREEYLTDDALAQALIAQAIIQDPQNSAAIIAQMSPAQQAALGRQERLVALPYNPNYYRQERLVPLPYNPNYYKSGQEHLASRFVSEFNA